MKTAKRIAAVMVMLVMSVMLMKAYSLDAQAATKSHTYVLDKKSGAGYPTAVRVTTQATYQDFYVYVKNKGDYVAKVTTNSPNLIAKVTRTNKIVDEGGYTSTGYFESEKFKGSAEITCFARTAGTYKVTFTVKDSKNRQIAKKTVTVYAGESQALEKATFDGKDINYTYSPSKNVSKKAKGKLSVKAGKDFTIKKIQIGGYGADGTINYKTVKNNSTITLSTTKKFTKKDNSYSSDYSSYEYGYNYDYIYPVTYVKVTIYDKKLKTTYDTQRTIFKQ